MHSLREKVKEQLVLSSDVKSLRIIDKILHLAIAAEAEEIIFEPDRQGLAVVFHSHGEGKKIFVLSEKIAASVRQGLKAAGGVYPLTGKNLTDGKFKKDFLGYKIVFSLAVRATSAGEKIIVGLQKKQFELKGVGRLGLAKKSAEAVKRILQKRKGLLLVAGSGDSGVTTTLYSFLNYVNQPHLSAATIEKEIACDLPNVNQSRLDPLSGFSADLAIRSLARQDSEVVMIGELDDFYTAEAAMQLALSGHFVLAGVNSPTIVSALSVLRDLSVSAPLFNAAVKLVLAQRLIDGNCPYCLVKDRPNTNTFKKIKEKINFNELLKKMRRDRIVSSRASRLEQFTFYKNKGCAKCRQTGKLGKIGIFEILEITPAVKKIIKANHLNLIGTEIIKQGNYSLAEDALTKAMNGLTKISEVVKLL
ncbi:MAG TPA: ATPase, T2SS/T4P/T4SS family [Candidatus Methylomirabilis sp.]|nr:ATPase, T2SS/T4P/T4SS family [Candidatus Methylomirabilis sp.]